MFFFFLVLNSKRSKKNNEEEKKSLKIPKVNVTKAICDVFFLVCCFEADRSDASKWRRRRKTRRRRRRKASIITPHSPFVNHTPEEGAAVGCVVTPSHSRIPATTCITSGVFQFIRNIFNLD